MIYRVACSKCGTGIETISKPITTGFLCNSCNLKWLDLKRKYTGEGTNLGPRAYQDEMYKAFIKFVNDRTCS